MVVRQTLIMALAPIFAIGCQVSQPEKTVPPTTASDLASVAMLFAPPATLAGEPNLYDFKVNGEDELLQSYRGDLPDVGEIIRLHDLPGAEGVAISGGLYRDDFLQKQQTHSCASQAPANLVAGATTTIALACTPVINTQTDPVTVFFKVAKIEASLTESTTRDFLANIDWSAPKLFSYADEQGQLISLRSDGHSLTLHISGRASYRATPATAKTEPLMATLLAGGRVSLDLIAGEQRAGAPAQISLTMEKDPAVYALPEPRAVVFVRASDDEGLLDVRGSLVERDPLSEFTVVSYNVENLFDQMDEPRNAHYGDYRINRNERGFDSNYGTPVEFEGSMVSFTEVKIAGIRRALTAIEPEGPAIVGLQEIESPAALAQLQAAVADLGYAHAQFGDWGTATPNAVSTGFLSKFPITDWRLIEVAPPADAEPGAEPPRRVFRVELDVLGHPLVIYNNHWKSKGGPESRRIASAEAIERDVQELLLARPAADYLILGDLNSNYNEKATIEPRHDDADGLTGINDIIRAQGDERATQRDNSTGLKYNLHFELNRAQRRTAFHTRYGWSSMDHIILGSGLYTGSGLVYVDNSFEIAAANMPALNFLFKEDGTSKRWNRVRRGTTSIHSVGGFADHVPLFARFRVDPLQNDAWIRLFRPGRNDQN